MVFNGIIYNFRYNEPGSLFPSSEVSNRARVLRNKLGSMIDLYYVLFLV